MASIRILTTATYDHLLNLRTELRTCVEKNPKYIFDKLSCGLEIEIIENYYTLNIESFTICREALMRVFASRLDRLMNSDEKEQITITFANTTKEKHLYYEELCEDLKEKLSDTKVGPAEYNPAPIHYHDGTSDEYLDYLDEYDHYALAEEGSTEVEYRESAESTINYDDIY